MLLYLRVCYLLVDFYRSLQLINIQIIWFKSICFLGTVDSACFGHVKVIDWSVFNKPCWMVVRDLTVPRWLLAWLTIVLHWFRKLKRSVSLQSSLSGEQQGLKLEAGPSSGNYWWSASQCLCVRQAHSSSHLKMLCDCLPRAGLCT